MEWLVALLAGTLVEMRSNTYQLCTCQDLLMDFFFCKTASPQINTVMVRDDIYSMIFLFFDFIMIFSWFKSNILIRNPKNFPIFLDRNKRLALLYLARCFVFRKACIIILQYNTHQNNDTFKFIVYVEAPPIHFVKRKQNTFLLKTARAELAIKYHQL